MTAITAQSGSIRAASPPVILTAVLVALVAAPSLALLLPPALVDVPASLQLPIAKTVGDWLTWLARKAEIGPYAVQDITRAMTKLVEWPIDALNVILAQGIKAGTGNNVHTVVPPLSWLSISGLLALIGWRFGGPRLALITAAAMAYLIIFGFWTAAMTTLSSVMISAVVAIALGIYVGNLAVNHARLEAPLTALMNVMQTVPIFAYLVPTLLFLGYGPSAALVATVIYALPPMVHATILGLRGVPSEVVEYGTIAGATERTIFWKIKLPVALPTLAIGINQTIMACLNIVVIASMIGAGGLGYLVLVALRKLDIGGALESGIAIVLLAIVLDRLSLAAARRSATGARHSQNGRSFGRIVLIWIAVSTALAFLLPSLQTWPKAWEITTAPTWNAMVSWINVNWFTPLDAIRSFTLINLMIPTKQFLLDLPWTLVIVLIAIAAWRAGGTRLALTCIALALFVAVTGFWEPAIVSVYLVALGVLISVLIGMPIGYFASRSARRRETMSIALDTLQTLPTLVYLLPAVMLFRNGDFSALIAIVSYAIAPPIRYAMHAFAAVPADRLEAAAMAGAGRWQTMKWVRLPAAFPTLILGLNQTVMMAIAMLVITALVGTRDLGQQVFIALSRAKVGDGIIAGLCVAAIALIADGILKALAARRAAEMGSRLQQEP